MSPAAPGTATLVARALRARPRNPLAGARAPSSAAPRVAVISDTLDDVNGVALGLRRLAAACEGLGLPLSLVGPDLDAPRRGRARVRVDDERVVRVPTRLRRSIWLYPEMTWGVPRLGLLARWLQAARVDLVQVATPGPMGVAGLLAARGLGLPVLAQFHTDVPEYARLLSGRPALGELATRVVAWFYGQADLCLAPSAAVEARLRALGVAPARVARVPRGIDLSLFHPSRRDPAVRARLAPDGGAPERAFAGLAGGTRCSSADASSSREAGERSRRTHHTDDGPLVLFLGRLSREKGFDRLLAAWREVHAARPDARLALVGDGPLGRHVGGPGVVCTGMLHGDELGAVVASADLLAFPSETETFGNAVVEAMAAGLPAVVAAGGAAREHVVHGVDGLVVEASGAAPFAAAILDLLADAGRRARMGGAAHQAAQRHELTAAARATYELYRGQVVAGRRARAEGARGRRAGEAT